MNGRPGTRNETRRSPHFRPVLHRKICKGLSNSDQRGSSFPDVLRVNQNRLANERKQRKRKI